MKLSDQYLSLKSLSGYADIPLPTLRDYIKTENLPCFKLKGKILVRKSEFDAWVDSYRVKSDNLDSIVDDVMNNLSSE